MLGRLRLPGLSKPEGFAKVTTAASVFRTDVRNREAGVVGFELDCETHCVRLA
jgi:hypothetical protein